jgi:hypothetical protein
VGIIAWIILGLGAGLLGNMPAFTTVSVTNQ